MQDFSIPAHVRPDQVFDWHMYAQPEGDDTAHATWKKMHAEGVPDIFWTPHNGGHWVAARGEDIEFIQRNHDPFSNDELTIPAGVFPVKLAPAQLDPPEHGPHRAVINLAVGPKAINALEPDIRQLARDLIEGFYGRGECEFNNEFARHLPIVIFLKLMGLPLEDRESLLEWAETATRGETAEIRNTGQAGLIGYLHRWVEERRANPGPDLFSQVVNATVAGEPISTQRMQGMLHVLLLGGLDTVVSVLGFFARFLAEHPGHRRQLVDNPALIPDAVDELLRRFGVASLARIVSRDFEYKDVHFRKGDMLLLPTMMYGLDERKFDNPLEVDFHRKNKIHAAFGNGIHRCPGSFLARTELRIFLEEWLARIPEFKVKSGAKAKEAIAGVHAVTFLPLAWNVVR
jgi:cytochrome P450